MITKPQPEEYGQFYARYINRAIDTDILETLASLKDSSHQLFTTLPPEKGDHAYAEGKWTIKQMLNHLIDAERIFAYRILSFSRNDQNPLPGFDEVDYASEACVDDRSLYDLADEFKTLRKANLYLFRSITDAQSRNMGVASSHPVSVRALLYITAGHEMHHIQILHERYL